MFINIVHTIDVCSVVPDLSCHSLVIKPNLGALQFAEVSFSVQLLPTLFFGIVDLAFRHSSSVQ